MEKNNSEMIKEDLSCIEEQSSETFSGHKIPAVDDLSYEKIMIFLQAQKETIFKIANKLKKSDDIEKVRTDLKQIINKLKSKYHLIYNRKLTKTTFNTFSHSIFVVVSQITSNNPKNNFYDSMLNNDDESQNIKNFQHNKNPYKNSEFNDFPISRSSNDNEITIAHMLYKANANKKDSSESMSYLDDNFFGKNATKQKNKNIEINNLSRRINFNESRNISKSFENSFNMMNIQKTMLNKCNKDKCKNKNNTIEIFREESYINNDFSKYYDFYYEKFREQNKLTDQNIYIQNLHPIEYNVENSLKEIIFLIFNSEKVFFSNPEITNSVLEIIFWLLYYNFIIDIKYIHTIFLKICEILKRDYEDLHSEKLNSILLKVKSTDNYSLNYNFSKSENIVLFKNLEDSLNALKQEIKDNYLSDPINNFKYYDKIVKNKISSKLNEYDVLQNTLEIEKSMLGSSYQENNKLNISLNKDYNDTMIHQVSKEKINIDFKNQKRPHILADNNNIDINNFKPLNIKDEKEFNKPNFMEDDPHMNSQKSFISKESQILGDIQIRNNSKKSSLSKEKMSKTDTFHTSLNNMNNLINYNVACKNTNIITSSSKDKKDALLLDMNQNHKLSNRTINKNSSEKTQSFQLSEPYSTTIKNNSYSNIKSKIKENFIHEKIMEIYVELKYESEKLTKKLDDINFNNFKSYKNQLITNFSEIERQYLYFFKCLLERIDESVYKILPDNIDLKSEFFKQKFFYILFRSKIFNEYLFKQINIKNNFLSIQNKAVFLDQSYKIGRFLFNFILENNSLKTLNFQSKSEFTRLCKNMSKLEGFNFQLDDIFQENEESGNKDFLFLRKLKIKKLYLPYINLRKKINSIIRKLKETITSVFRNKNIDESNCKLYEPILVNSLNYLYFYNVNVYESSEIYLNYNILNVTSKNVLVEIIEEISQHMNMSKEIKKKIYQNTENGVFKILMKAEKLISNIAYSFNIIITFNCEDCFIYENLLSYCEYDIKLLYMFRIFKFFFIQRNMFYTFSTEFSKSNESLGTNFKQELLFDNISLLALLIIFFFENNLIPHKKADYIYKKFYCQRMNIDNDRNNKNNKNAAVHTANKIDEYHFIFPYLNLEKSFSSNNFNFFNKEREKGDLKNRKMKIYEMGNLYVNFCYFILNLIEIAKERKNKTEENYCLVIDLERLAFLYRQDIKSKVSLILSGIEKFVNTTTIDIIRNRKNNTNSITYTSSITAKDDNFYNIDYKINLEEMNKNDYMSFVKKFKAENKGKDILISFDSIKLEKLEFEITRCLHYFLKENDEDFIKAFL